MTRKKRILRFTAKVLLVTMTFELVSPMAGYALTTGPSQPEVQSFEPVGTTDMVDLFTGDFVYNIPLMDVEGYPVNISYHGGVGMEQEASWVGLGWNINPGVVNRTVRGIPDDFNGEELQKKLNIKPEENLRIGMGGGGELFGAGDPLIGLSANVGTNLNINNYRGVSVDFSFGGGVQLFRSVSAGINIGVGSQTGGDIDYHAGLQFSSSQAISKDVAAGVGMSFGSGYNTRSGMKDMNFSVGSNVRAGNVGAQGPSMSTTIPIGVRNFVPVITNSSQMRSIYGRIKIGLELLWCNGYGNVNGMGSRLTYNSEGTRKSYGYLYSENANDSSIHDFTRDKDGMFNKTMQYLPLGQKTYDIYSVSAQGTGGSFRPYRNDFGSVYDPIIKSDQSSSSGQGEASFGWLFGAGGDGSKTKTDISSGPWQEYNKPYSGNDTSSLYENTYFKQGGELTAIDQGYYASISGAAAVDAQQANGMGGKSANARDARATLFTCLNGEEASIPEVASSKMIYSYESTTGFANGPVVDKDSFSRKPGGYHQRKGHHISEVIQTQKDGTRYVYGIPAMNNIQREATFAIDQGVSLSEGTVIYGSNDDSESNDKGRDNYYSSTITPAYAHSYLLTSVLSTDYVDVTGNGVSDDDLGSFTKLNYALKEDDYRWKIPYGHNKAQYNPGFWSDTKDDRGSYIIGSREQWMLHSIETKNFVAEFYVSPREDGKGSTEAIKGGAPYDTEPGSAANSYKLDSIKLYNKHDRFINTVNAVPIKTVMFEYDYSLCQGVPNNFSSVDGQKGKLTLKKIYMKYGNSEKSMLSPYQFNYRADNPDYNPSYDLAAKDRWGNYKPNGSPTNYEYPFVDQEADNDRFAGLWSLHEITLPSGGIIEVNYESDDYAFVQDRKAMEMFQVAGIGISPHFIPGDQLYFNKFIPNLYIFFKRRADNERTGNIQQDYLNGVSVLAYNFRIRMPNGQYEAVKGYATVAGAGVSSNPDYGYIQLNGVTPKGGGWANPVAYTALNQGRYNLPHILFPGSDPNASNFNNILAGLKQSFDELVSFTKNPVTRLLEDGHAQYIDKTKSYIRLASPDMRKNGGGHRVGSMMFYDSWDEQAGGNAQEATYGKEYDYSIDEPSYGNISSGVASYEPAIGGDENPFREPVTFTVQAGASWPPNDPIELYQETPLGESLYPSPVVGYRKVTVSSIHEDYGRSSQGVDIYRFYTAKEYPVKVLNTPLNKVRDVHDFGMFDQENIFEATQGYSVILNDMHGKPQSTEHYVRKPDGTKPLDLISSQQYVYNTNGDGQLSNLVNVLAYNPGQAKLEYVQQVVGVEVDMTMDAREKTEHTSNDNFNVNVNATNILFVLIPIPLPFGWEGEYKNEFRSAVCTKVVQQYGVLKKVISFNEGAYTELTNEVFDAKTGQPVITSVNNEFGDLEYSVSYPAYWGHKNMGAAYENAGYRDTWNYISIDSATGTGLVSVSNRVVNYRIGDKIWLSYDHNGPRNKIVWVTGFKPALGDNDPCCNLEVSPRYPLAGAPDWPTTKKVDTLQDVSVKILRSGNRNILTATMLDYRTLGNPVIEYVDKGGGASGILALMDLCTNAIEVKATVYSDSLSTMDTDGSDTLVVYANGQRGVFRPIAEYVPLKNRNNALPVRNSGLYDTDSLWKYVPEYSAPCDNSLPYAPACGDPDNILLAGYFKREQSPIDWIKVREIFTWTPFSKEVEERDAVDIPSTAVYGYNEQLPVAVAHNAHQGSVLAESFEDYRMLMVHGNPMERHYSPFKSLFGKQAIGASQYRIFNMTGSNCALAKDTSHTGDYSLRTDASVNVSTGIAGSLTAGNYLKYAPFGGTTNSYIISFWVRPVSIQPGQTSYSLPSSWKPASNIIDGWQKVEYEFTPSAVLSFQGGYYIDDVRIFPKKANMKSFVYHPFNQRLMATLDENNFATMYEYDQEGNLIRTKKETEKGIITISESRSENPKNVN